MNIAYNYMSICILSLQYNPYNIRKVYNEYCDNYNILGKYTVCYSIYNNT
jgi:hypothetical protein